MWYSGFMSKLFLLLPLVFTLLSCGVGAEPLKVAIIDTGLDINDNRFSGHICSEGHKSFSGSLSDNEGHGTHVAGIIKQNAGNGNYCFLIYKFYNENFPDKQNVINEINAIEEAIKNGAKIINISGGGQTKDDKEKYLIENNPDVIFVVASGNDGIDLDISRKKFYPASYFLPNEVVVGNLNPDGTVNKTSNYGSRVKFEIGTDVLSYFPNGRYGYLTGTSMATAVRTGKIIKAILK